MDMNFYDALKELAQGAIITRREWKNPFEQGFLDGDVVKIQLRSGIHNWIVSIGDLEATDWEIVKKR